MQDISLDLKEREVVGKQVKALRREGMVPAVIHDHGKESVIVMAPYIDASKVFQQAGKHHPINLTVGTKKYMALIKDADVEPKKRTLRHIVFNAVNANETVEAEVPIHITFDEGNETSPAERAGLIVLHALESVQVEALPKDLPDAITFNGEKLVEIGDHATVADLIVPAGVTILTDPEHVIANVYEPSALAAANEAAGGDAEEEVPATEEGEGEAETIEGGETSEATAEAPKE